MQHAADERELLAVLRVDEHTPWEDVRRAFRDAVRANHPDLHPGNAGAERRLKALNAAWESINSPSKWAAYVGQPAPQGSTGATASAGSRAAASSVGLLRVLRQQRGSAGLLNWWLELDGEVVAAIENGGVSIVEAEPGRHSLRVFYGSHSSLPLHVDLRRGQERVLGCRQLESLRISLVSRKRALVLELLDG
jgi:DnaJ domain